MTSQTGQQIITIYIYIYIWIYIFIYCPISQKKWPLENEIWSVNRI